MAFMDFISGKQVNVKPAPSCTGYCRILRNSPYHTAQTEGFLLTQIAKEYAEIESQLRLIDWINAQPPYEITNPKCPGCIAYSPAEKAKLIGLAQQQIAESKRLIGLHEQTLNKLREQYQGSAIGELGASNLIPDEEFQKGLISGGLRNELREKLEKLFPKLMPKKTTPTPAENVLKETVEAVAGGASGDTGQPADQVGQAPPPGPQDFMPILLISGALALVFLLRR